MNQYLLEQYKNLGLSEKVIEFGEKIEADLKEGADIIMVKPAMSYLDIVKEAINDTPVLLLDDFMSELDEIRRTSFLENIKDCQVILTCTDKIDLERESDIFYVDNGICNKE